MKIIVCTPIFLFLSLSSAGQLNTDSLLKILDESGHYHKSLKPLYLTDSFQRYENRVEMEHYDVYLDSSGQLSEYCGQTIIHRKFDSLGRITFRTGYMKDGRYRYFDYSPIILISYLNDTTVKDYFDENNKFRRREILIRDKLGRVLEERVINNAYQLTDKKIIKYSDSSGFVVVSFLDSLGHYKPNEHGVSVLLQKFHNDSALFLTEQHYLDSNGKPVEARHESSNEPCSYYKKVNYGSPDSGNDFSYFNAKDELACSDDWMYWFYEK